MRSLIELGVPIFITVSLVPVAMLAGLGWDAWVVHLPVVVFFTVVFIVWVAAWTLFFLAMIGLASGGSRGV